MNKLIFSTLLVLSAKALAVPAVLGQPALGGNGCRPGTYQYQISADASAALIHFDELLAVTNQQTSRIQRVSCTLAIPIKVSPGYSIALMPVFEGNVYASGAGQLTLNLDNFVAGAKPNPSKAVFQRADQPLRFPSTIKPKLQWTACGASANLRLNFSILAMNNDTAAQVDTLKYQVISRRCK